MNLSKLLATGCLVVFSLGAHACPPPPQPLEPAPAPTPRTAFWSKNLGFLAYPGSRMMAAVKTPVEVEFHDEFDRPGVPVSHFAGISDMTLTKSSVQEVMAYYQKLLPGAERDSSNLYREGLTYSKGWTDQGLKPVGSVSISISCSDQEFSDGKWTVVTVGVQVGLDPARGSKIAPHTKQMHSMLSRLQQQVAPGRIVLNR